MEEKNYNFYMQTNLSEFIGQWVAISESKIISHDKDLKKVYKEAKSLSKGKRPLFVKVPDKETMIF
ncbi:MAG: Succinyl-CoA synthetase Alpha subunit [archaeon GW2011_AR20]|nr:MAG: Succinyl-CoA synthetase Alpha subunit [archaeon GW2011_AR20]MBS3161041.1 hypothetical protein [Candidatus Woesearchaeota archaeon]